MNISMQLAVLAVAACLCLADGAPGTRLARTKQQRPTRGFKNVEMMTARGFGKRDRPNRAEQPEKYERHFEKIRRRFNPKTSLLVAPDFGKRSAEDDSQVYGLDNFWEMLESAPEREGQDQTEDKSMDSISLDWFVSEMLNNPEFTRSVVRKFIDLNQDGMLSSEELLRSV